MSEAIYTIGEGEEERAWRIETLEAGRYRVVAPDGSERVVLAYEPEPGRLHLIEEASGRARDLGARIEAEHVQIEDAGRRYAIEALNARARMRRAASGGAAGQVDPTLLSQMAGRVVAVDVRLGQMVEQGERVAVIEAMKMENDVKAHRAGIIGAIRVEPGAAVEIGQPIVRIDDAESS